MVNWEKKQTTLGFNTLSPGPPKIKNIPPITPSRVRKRQELEDEDEEADNTPRKFRNIGKPPDTTRRKLWKQSGPEELKVQGKPQGSKGEAETRLEEHKIKQGGRLKQSTIEGFIAKTLKKRENPTEDARSKGNLPKREGGDEEAIGGGVG